MKSYFPLQPTFFGLSDKYIEDIYEQFFILKYHGRWSFTEAYNLPIKLREWFVHRLLKQKSDEAEALEQALPDDGHTTTQLGPGVKPPTL